MILLLALLAAPAAALEPTADLHVLGSLSTAGQDVVTGVATGGAAGLVLTGPLDVELSLDAGVSTAESIMLAATPQLRLWLTPRQGRAGALSLSAGGGLWVAPDAGPVLTPGIAWDLPGKKSFVPRLQVRALVDPGDGHSAVTLGLGVAGPHRRATPPPEPVAVTPPPEPEPYVWYPHPVSSCVLSPQIEATAGAVGASGDTPTEAATGTADTGTASGALPAQPQPLDLAALLEPSGGGLVIVASPGDEVLVSGHLVPVGPDGVVVMATDAGPQVVDITGAGRARSIKPSIADAHATWVRAPSYAGDHLLHFAAGSAELDEDERARAAAIAARAGGWRFQLVGAYSPEGTVAANQRLASDRADATRAALVAAGLPADRITVAPPEPGDLDARIEDQRVCRVVPLPPEVSP